MLTTTTYKEYAKEFLRDLFTKLLKAIVEDQLIKVMSLEETSGSFIFQRVGEIIDIVYKQDRERMIEALID
jgi:hypothetical protein